VSVKLGNGLTVYSVPPPASGALLTYILNILKNYEFQVDDLLDETLLYHRITEALKWAYGQRSKLGDPFDSEITDDINEVCKQIYVELKRVLIFFHIIIVGGKFNIRPVCNGNIHEN
jgi:gamma-glutamyltranspeptidase/glutathione hydrolase/leukotriene-C4 hydrolase